MKEELLAYGLSDKEIDLYLAALKLGDSTANRLSEVTKLTRSTVYDVAGSLEKKGLMGSYKKDKKIFFSANNPASLITRLREKEQVVKQILPDLQDLIEHKPDKPIITVYRGIAGMRAAANEMLNSKEILVYGGGKNADKVFGTYTENFAQKRVAKKIILRTIVGPSVPAYMLATRVKKYTPIRTLEVFENHATTYFVYGNTVLFWNYKQDLIAVKVESRDFASSQRQIFEFFWGIAKKV